MDKTQAEWQEAIREIQDCRIEYERLINELREIRKDLIDAGIKPPFYVRLYYKLKHLLRR